MRKIKQIFAGILTVLIVFSTLGESLQLHASELASQAESVSGGKDGTEIWEPGQEESEFDEVEASEEESVADGTEAIEEESVADGTEAIEEESVADGAVSVEEESVANGAEPGQEESGVGEPEAVEKDGGTDGTESGQEESGTDKAEIAQEESVINDESTESGQHSVFVEQDSESIGMYAVPKAAGDLPENWVTVENPPVTQFVSDNKGGYCYKISYESTSGNSYIGKIFDAQGDLKEEQIKFSFDFMYESIGDGAKTQFFMDGSNIKPGTWATRVEIDAKGYYM